MPIRFIRLIKQVLPVLAILLLGYLAPAFSGVVPPRQDPANPTWVPGEILVKFKDQFTVEVPEGGKMMKKTVTSVDKLNEKYQVIGTEKVFKTAGRRAKPVFIKTYTGEVREVPQLFNIYKLKLPKETDIKPAVEDYGKNPNVEYAEPNYIAHIAAVPNDPDFSQQWGLNNTGQYRLVDADIDAPEAWEVEQGDSTVIIGIVDTGVDWSHPDLADHIVSHGYDFVNDDDDADDDNGHGTHVAGIAAAATNNGIGISGVAWNCKILPVKVLQSNGTGSYSDIANGAIYAADNGAKVINLSLGGYAESYVLRDVLENAYATAVLVASAGNGETSQPYYPAAWSFAIGVGASGVFYNQQTQSWYEGVARFSNGGLNADLYAPGVNIYSTIPLFHPHGHSYAYWNGTSMAAPFVAGTVALLRSHFPNWSNELIHGQIINTTDPIVSGVRLNAYNALTTGSEPQLSLYSHTVLDTLAGDDRDGVPDAGETIEMVFDIQNTWGWAYNVQATLRPHSYEDMSFVTILDSTATFGGISAYGHETNETSPFVFSLKSSTPNNTDIYFDCEITCDNGAPVTETFHITAQRGFEISGIISENTTWSNDYLYIVTGNVLVDEGVTLTIEPGTRIQFCPEKYLRVDGCLEAIGASDSMIVFTSNAPNPTSGDWDCIRFADPSEDAVFDAASNYVSGSIIKHAEVKFSGGIWADHASPYIAYNFIHDNHGHYSTCMSPLHLKNSSSVVEHNSITNNYEGDGGGISLWDCSEARVSDNIIESNCGEAGGIRLNCCSSSVVITRNIIRGNRSLGRSGGGISVHGSSSNITYNIIDGNSSPENKGGIFFYNNSSAQSVNNTIMNNQQGIVIWDAAPTITYNNVINNRQNSNQYEIKQWKETELPSYDINAPNNYWGTTNTDSIDAWIWDYYDDFDLGIVTYQPFETTPIADAPGFLYQVELNPPSPIGCQVDTFTLIFSKPMDISVQPQVTFGVCDPYTQHTIQGDWADSTHWQSTYAFNIMTGDGINRLRVTTAQDCEGMEIPKDTRFAFVVDAAGAASEGFIAQAGDGRVDLSWHKPEMVDLMGYNLYRYRSLTDTTFSDTALVNTSMILDSTYTDLTVHNDTTYFYMFTAISTDFNESDYSDPVSATPMRTVAVEVPEFKPPLPECFALYQNFPNPFNPITIIQYQLPVEAKVKLEIYNVLGQKVKQLVNQRQKAGYCTVKWDSRDEAGREVAAGIYLYRLEAGEFSQTRRMVLLK